MWEWVGKYRHIIADQHQRLGASCDWTRERFTLDEGPQRAVRTTFAKLYHEGLIYRGERIINWCPRCQTALSDLEVEHKEHASHLWYVRYPLLDDQGEPSGEYITVATTRPETILGDTAVAVNPDDARYRRLVGRTALLPVMARRIPIIADAAVDPAFGTGAGEDHPRPTTRRTSRWRSATTCRIISVHRPGRHDEREGRPLRRPWTASPAARPSCATWRRRACW